MAARATGDRRALRDTLLMAATSNANILSNIVRVKVLAMVLGPAGIGALGLMQAIVGTASLAFGLGADAMAVRELAAARGAGNDQEVVQVRAALRRGLAVFAVLGGLAVAIFAPEITRRVDLPAEYVVTVRWLSIGVAAGVLSAGLRAELNGFQMIGDLARATVASSLLLLIATVGAAFTLPDEAALVIASAGVGVTGLVAFGWSARRLPRLERPPPVAASATKVLGLARLGLMFTIGGLAPVGSQLVARSLLADSAGIDTAGQYQAAWTLSSTYVGVLLSSLGTSLLPRLSAVNRDAAAIGEMLNEQARTYLLLFGPLFVAMLVFSPVAIHVLYSRDFATASEILRWQLLGDIFKIPAWTLSTAMPALGLGRGFLLTQLVLEVVYLSLLAAAVGAGAAPSFLGGCFAAAYLVHFVLLSLLSRRAFNFRWRVGVLRPMVLYAVAGLAFLTLTPWPYVRIVVAGTAVAVALVDSVKALLAARRDSKYETPHS